MECGGLAPHWIESVFALEFGHLEKLPTRFDPAVNHRIGSRGAPLTIRRFRVSVRSPKNPKWCQGTALHKVQKRNIRTCRVSMTAACEPLKTRP
ncbi:MAG: hypothetical protein CMJ78_10300 [Planctomycetaceae bacterium]|nr:hypothetical protein [Planctomycetaceae bacterium]